MKDAKRYKIHAVKINTLLSCNVIPNNKMDRKRNEI